MSSGVCVADSRRLSTSNFCCRVQQILSPNERPPNFQKWRPSYNHFHSTLPVRNTLPFLSHSQLFFGCFEGQRFAPFRCALGPGRPS